MHTTLNFEKNTRTGIVHIIIAGSLCGKEAADFKAKLQALLKQGNRFISIRAENLDTIDLTCVNAWVTMLKQFRDVKGELYLNYKKDGEVAEWLHLTKFNHLFQAIPSNLY